MAVVKGKRRMAVWVAAEKVVVQLAEGVAACCRAVSQATNTRQIESYARYSPHP